MYVCMTVARSLFIILAPNDQPFTAASIKGTCVSETVVQVVYVTLDSGKAVSEFCVAANPHTRFANISPKNMQGRKWHVYGSGTLRAARKRAEPPGRARQPREPGRNEEACGPWAPSRDREISRAGASTLLLRWRFLCFIECHARKCMPLLQLFNITGGAARSRLLRGRAAHASCIRID